MAAKKEKILKLLFLDILTDDLVIRNRIEKLVYNDKTYGEEVRSIIGLNENEFVLTDASMGVFPNPNNYRAIIIGGSTEDPINDTEKEWVKKTYNFIKLAIKAKIPILGICGGLQFVIRALGGEIIYNPKGRNFGNNIIYLTKEGIKDNIFSGLPKSFEVFSSHKCIVKNLQQDWVRLGFSQKTPFEAIAIGNNIRLTQFHPEMTFGAMKSLSLIRKDSLIKEGYLKKEDFSKFLQTLNNDKNIGKKIINNFIDNFTDLKIDRIRQKL